MTSGIPRATMTWEGERMGKGKAPRFANVPAFLWLGYVGLLVAGDAAAAGRGSLP